MMNLSHEYDRSLFLKRVQLYFIFFCIFVSLFIMMSEVQAQALDHTFKKSSPSTLIAIPKSGDFKNQAKIARGQIYIQDLEATVKSGIPALLAQARLKPIKRKGRFVGFQLALIKQGSLLQQAGFRKDDIIMTVNDEPIGRPEQMMHTLSILPYAPHLSVTFERQGIIKKWTWLIRR